jgi:hypothetical protein
MQKAPITRRKTLAAGEDCERPNETVPARHRIMPGITSVTMPGSRMMARRCFHIVVACPFQAIFERSDSGSAHICSSVSMIMGTDSEFRRLEGLARLAFGPWEQVFCGVFGGRCPKRVLVKVIGQ